MTYSLDGLTTLGIVTGESQNKDAGLFQQPMPASDADEAILLDIFGASRTINIDGIFIDGTSSKTVAQFIAELDGLVNGNQTSRTFASDKSGVSYEILVQSVSWKAEEAAVTKVNYTISMIEGSI